MGRSDGFIYRSMIESVLLLFLVVDPFGNLPVVLAVVGKLAPSSYRRIIIREVTFAFLVLLLFAFAGERVLGYLNIEQTSLTVAGGVILFIVSLKMIFRSAAEIFDDNYRDDPILFPIAVPLLAGPSAITTVMILRTQQQLEFGSLLLTLAAVFAVTCTIFLPGQRICRHLGLRGVRAMEKLMGLLLNLLAVNMILVGIKTFLMA